MRQYSVVAISLSVCPFIYIENTKLRMANATLCLKLFMPFLSFPFYLPFGWNETCFLDKWNLQCGAYYNYVSFEYIGQMIFGLFWWSIFLGVAVFHSASLSFSLFLCLCFSISNVCFECSTFLYQFTIVYRM